MRLKLLIWAILLGIPLSLAAQTFNVTTYGAKCDGATDDTTAIQAAISAASAVNGTAFIPPTSGGCVSASFITLPSRVTLSGLGKSTLKFTGNGDGACTAAEKPVSTGFIRWSGGGNRVTQLNIVATQYSAGTCLLDLQDGAETSGVEIDHNNIGSNNPADTNTGIYSYANDTISIHDNVFKYIGEPIFGGAHTWAKITIGPNNIFWGQIASRAMISTPSGLNCFSVSISHNVFEGYYSTNGINSSCANGLVIESNYFGDASPTGGTWIQTRGTLIGNYISSASNGKALSGSFTAIGNFIYGPSLMDGTFIANNFSSAGGCYITTNQGGVIESIRNSFGHGASYSYCAANGLTPAPIVMRMHDMDATVGGIRPGVTIQ